MLLSTGISRRLLASLALLMTACAGGGGGGEAPTPAQGTDSPTTQVTSSQAWNAAADLGRGINLGNVFEAPREDD